jgi:mannosyl-oligosaccharide glucosidase
MNINFLITMALHRYSNDETLNDSLRASIETSYQGLRNGLIGLIVDSYTSTGFIWEVYNGDSGAGMDNHPFTGWSALVTNLMAEVY